MVTFTSHPEPTGKSAALRESRRLLAFGAKTDSGENVAGPMRSFSGAPNSAEQHPAGLLSSWKDIANYLSRGVRTVQRWELTLGLPVHRIGTGKRGAVLAFKHEIHSWLRANVCRTPVNRGLPMPQSNSRPQQLARLVQELRESLFEVRQEVAAEVFEQNANITEALLSIQTMVNAALAPSQADPVEVSSAKGDLPDEIVGRQIRKTDRRRLFSRV
jgi:hypothetical protein